LIDGGQSLPRSIFAILFLATLIAFIPRLRSRRLSVRLQLRPFQNFRLPTRHGVIIIDYNRLQFF